MAGVLKLRVVSANRTVFEGNASSMVVPAWDGQLGVLPGHAPLIALLGAGEIAIDLPGGGSETFFLAGGAIKVENDEVTVLSEFAADRTPEQVPPEVEVPDRDELFSFPGDPLV